MAEKRTPIQRRIRPSVPVEIQPEGITLRLSFSMNALARIEERVNQQRLAALSRMIADPKELVRLYEQTKLRLAGNIFALWIAMASQEVILTTFWATAVENHPEYDTDEGYAVLTSLVDNESMDRIGQAVLDTYKLSLSKTQLETFEAAWEKAKRDLESQTQEKPRENPPEAHSESSTGSNSGPSPDTTSESAASASSGS